MELEPGSSVAGPAHVDYVQLTVGDTGAGIDPEIAKRIFEPFFTTREMSKGTGMGLFVVHGIVKDLHGMIGFEGEPGVGTIFRVFLPKVDIDLHKKVSEASEIITGNERILFVDDENMLVEWGKASLERLGYHVVAETDPDEALKIFSSDPSRFDLVITDQSMPSMTGMKLAGEFLNIRSDIPIILLTGNAAILSAETAKEAGLKQFLMKPLTRRELAQSVRLVLDEPGEQEQRGSFNK
jgi:CheY-like chemotaxis protein